MHKENLLIKSMNRLRDKSTSRQRQIVILQVYEIGKFLSQFVKFKDTFSVFNQRLSSIEITFLKHKSKIKKNETDGI